MNPIVSLVTEVEVATEVAVVAGKTTEEIGLISDGPLVVVETRGSVGLDIM